jgi:hypothetical protein
MKNLKITILILTTVVLTANCFGFDKKQALEYIKTPGAVEQFKKQKKSPSSDSSDTPPLVQEAEKFSLYLNPPEPKPQPQPRNNQKTSPRRSPAIPNVTKKPQRSSVKFDLLGTSHFPAEPKLSFALIDMPGKGLRWVQQSSKVGHLTVQQIKDGSIIVKDNSKTEEVFVPQPEKTNLLKNKDRQSQPQGGSSYSSTESVQTKKTEPQADKPAETTRKSAPPQAIIPDSKRAEVGEELMSQMDALSRTVKSGEQNPEQLKEKQKALIKAMFDKLDKATAESRVQSPNEPKEKSVGMSAEELDKLKEMGKPDNSKAALEEEKERIRKMFENLSEDKTPRDPNNTNSAKTKK